MDDKCVFSSRENHVFLQYYEDITIKIFYIKLYVKCIFIILKLSLRSNQASGCSSVLDSYHSTALR